jgi:MYXO-CTERM domain-containing protein
MPFRRKGFAFPLVQYGAVAALGALALGASKPKPSSPAGAAPSVGTATAGYVQLARGAHPLARPENDLGRLDPTKRLPNLSLVMRLSPQQEQERNALVEAVTDPKSPSYHQFLTPSEYAARFGAKPDDLARAQAWLEAQGFDVVESSPLGARIRFAGTVANVEAAFRAEMHRYQVDGEVHYAMASAPSVPADLAGVVLGVMNTHDFYPRPTLKRGQVRPLATCPAGDFLLCAGDGFTPPDWSKVYDVPTTYDGTGVTIMVVGVADILQSDLDAFRTTYNSSVSASDPIVKTVVPGTGAATAGHGAGAEAVLDLEWSSNIAPKATVNYVYTGADDPNVFDAVYYAVEQNFGGVLSVSWGGCEESATPADADTTEVFGSAADLLGISFIAAAGDSGAAGCQGKGGLYVGIPASFPGVTSVGGTQFPTTSGLFGSTGTVSGYSTTETVWNESDDPTAATGVAAGAGGLSVVFPRPSYQTQTTAPTCTPVGSLPVSGLTASAMRQVPDVSFTAAGGSAGYGYYIECTFDLSTEDCYGAGDTGGPSPTILEIGGTSASTPSFAGIVALANQAAKGRLGNVNPLLYQLPSSVFHDITTGNNEIKCTSDPGCGTGGLYGYAATKGYDCASGLGSVDATQFLTAVAALTPTTTTLAPVTSPLTAGAAVPLTATVASSSGTPTGTVTFTFQSYLANGAPDLSWPLGTASLAGGTASPSTAFSIPAGLVGTTRGVDLVAAYGGDSTHLPSTSSKVHVSFAPVSLCVGPGIVTASPGGTVTFKAMGGTAPYHYYIADLGYDDGTSTAYIDAGMNGSSLDENSGVLTVGTGQPGYVLVQVVDSTGDETFAEVTVGSPSVAAWWAGDAGVVVNACPGSDQGDDAGAGDGGTSGDASSGGGPSLTPGDDAGGNSGFGEDAGALVDAGGLVNANGDGGGSGLEGAGSSSSGCSCTQAGESGGGVGALLGAGALGLVLAGRRRRRSAR